MHSILLLRTAHFVFNFFGHLRWTGMIFTVYTFSIALLARGICPMSDTRV